MAVVLPNAVLTVYVLAHPWERDANGVPVPPNPNVKPAARGTWPGSVLEQPDGTWTVRLDPRAWPVEPGDTITDETGRSWTLSSARKHAVPGCSDADYVQAAATLNPPEVP
ncbi:hypothetical protein [Streptomyces griseomycini]|uniref:Uncharacterized protein n=1 Tax=Streptomyces griseomycini TaxID=66895 RepID=A0A7W7PWC5_9ACTN|nr:hypothetical protein [Streptomyces griseomycini]MBB4902512.1 hypothetical protein [Streptomyces griseomycini]GGR52141.1 hypothetical protein GCM10015536_67040 [Streptomyces griseomycini]